jgi:MbtH protein
MTLLSAESNCVVVVNEEEQYSLWPQGKSLPAGWEAVFGPCSRDECLQEIEQRWVDMRPKSLREAMRRAGHDNG